MLCLGDVIYLGVLYMCCIDDVDWIVYWDCVTLIYACGRVHVTVYVVVLWTNACICACICIASGPLGCFLLVIYMHVFVHIADRFSNFF